MDELISRQAAIDVLKMDTTIIPYKKARQYVDLTIEEISERLKKLPSAQLELIRCEDCKHWEGEKRGQFWYFEQCSLNQHIASCDDFCSRAERREEGGE